MEIRELEYWQSLIEHSIQRWEEDSITRLNGSDRLYYIGGDADLTVLLEIAYRVLLIFSFQSPFSPPI